MDENTKRAIMFVAALALIAVAFIYIQPKSPPGNNSTVNATPTPISGPLTVRNGDTVEIDYIVVVENGSIYDTSIESVARTAGIYKEGLHYKPYEFVVGNGEVITGLDSAVTGMRVGEEKNVSIQPSEAYGNYDETLLFLMSRSYNTSRLETVSMQDFLSVFPNFNFAANHTVSMGRWNASILAVSNESVVLRHDPEINQSIATQSWVETVTGLGDTYITLRREAILGHQYIVRGEDGTPRVAVVQDVNEDFILLDYNPPLAGQVLNFTIRMVNITRLSS